jgi:hypothetical protein
MNFADDGVTGYPDLGGDLTARQARDHKAAKLLDTLRIPGCARHDTAS